MKSDIIESLCGSLLGLLVAIIANYTALPYFWGLHPTIGDSVSMGLFFFTLSFVLRFVNRRLFRGLSI